MAKRQNGKRRSYAEIFLETLTKISPEGQALVGNINLRNKLGWDESRYERIKNQLFDENKIIVGRGRGGSVGLAKVPGTKALNVFISYCHSDEMLKVELVKHLEPLRRVSLIESWHDRKIKAGEDWDKSISSNLANADIILLLVSIDFINSTYCYDVELDKALELHASGKSKVIPIILRSCIWAHTPFAKFQALPKDARAVVAWPNADEALTNIAEGIELIAKDLLKSK
jgi:hypothetical protein